MEGREDKHRDLGPGKNLSQNRTVSDVDVASEAEHDEVACGLVGYVDHGAAGVSRAPLEGPMFTGEITEDELVGAENAIRAL